MADLLALVGISLYAVAAVLLWRWYRRSLRKIRANCDAECALLAERYERTIARILERGNGDGKTDANR